MRRCEREEDGKFLSSKQAGQTGRNAARAQFVLSE